MTRPVEVELAGANPRWRDVPMPGANAPFSLVRLDSAEGAFVVHGHFPAGFERPTPGGYEAAEEFLVLDGRLHLEDEVFERGDLVFVPARFRRTWMSAPEGCTVLAWFGGPAIFIPADELPGAHGDGLRAVRGATAAEPGPLLQLSSATWTLSADGDPDPGLPGDLVTADLTRWQRRGTGVAPSGGCLVRTEIVP